MKVSIFNLLSIFTIFSQQREVHGEECPTRVNVITLQDVKDAASASESIYKNELNNGQRIPGTNFTIFRQFHERFNDDDKGIKVIIAENGNRTMVVYRGTKGLDQLLLQVRSRIFDKKYKLYINGTEARILNFFYDAFQLSYNQIKAHLSDPLKKYILTGHSLGGALASILALKMTQEHNSSIWQNPKSCLITFGQPRVGKRDWANLHDDLIPTFRKLRFVYQSDPVTGIPQRLSGWAHHSRAVYMGATKTIHLGRKRRFITSRSYWQVCHDQEDYSCTNDVTVLPSAKHHSMTTYYNAVMDPPEKYLTKAGTKLNNFEDMLVKACKEPQSYYVASGRMLMADTSYWLAIFIVICNSFST